MGRTVRFWYARVVKGVFRCLSSSFLVSAASATTWFSST